MLNSRAAAASLLLGTVALGGCASSRMLSYGMELGDAVVRLGPAAFSVYIHPQDDTLMIQRGTAQANTVDSPQLIQIVGTTFLEPTGCSMSTPSLIGPGTWEAAYVCPPSIDLRQLAADQRATLRAGQPIHK